MDGPDPLPRYVQPRLATLDSEECLNNADCARVAEACNGDADCEAAMEAVVELDESGESTNLVTRIIEASREKPTQE